MLQAGCSIFRIRRRLTDWGDHGHLRWLLLGVTLTALAAGGVAWLSGALTVADYCWIAGTVAAILPATWWVICALRAGRFGVDILAGWPTPS